MDVIEHVLRPVLKIAGNVKIHVEVHTKYGLELPLCKNYRSFRIIDVRDRIGYSRLGPEKLHVGHLLSLVLLLGLRKVLDCILVNLLIHIECLLGKKSREICVLHLSHHIQT